jgi:biopolymer transport protein ExbD
VALLVTTASAQAQSAALRLYVLPDNHVRFENGPELDLDQLRLEVRKLKRRKPRPDIRLQLDKKATYDLVAKTLATFSDEDYGPHFGFVGLSRE